MIKVLNYFDKCLHFSEQAASCKTLAELRIWHEHSLPGGMQGLKLNEIFRKNLRVALLGGYV